MSTPEENKAIARRFLVDTIELGHVELLDEIYIPDSSAPDYVSLQDWKNLVLWHYQTAPGLKVNILDLMADGDKVIAYWQFSLTFTERPADATFFPPLGKPLSWTVATIFRIVNGKIVEVHWVNNWERVLFEVVAVPNQDLEKNKAVVKRHLKDVLEGGHVELIPETWSPDGSVPGMWTPEQWKETVLWWHKIAPGFKVNILDLIAESDKVTAYIQFDVTYSIPADPPPPEPFLPQGKPVSWKNMLIATIRDGKIVAENSITAWTDMLIEAGVNPMPKPAAAVA